MKMWSEKTCFFTPAKRLMLILPQSLMHLLILNVFYHACVVINHLS